MKTELKKRRTMNWRSVGPEPYFQHKDFQTGFHLGNLLFNLDYNVIKDER